jgi:Tol biopolymer transport system component
VTDGSAWSPRYAPDGEHVGFVSARSSTTVCICTIAADGTDASVMFQSDRLAVDWFDWVRPSANAVPPAELVSAPADALLLGIPETNDTMSLAASGPDRWSSFDLPVDGTLRPRQARWAAGHRRIVFTGSVPQDAASPVYGPAPPSGSERRPHWLLDVGSAGLTAAAESGPVVSASQVFLADLDTGETRQLTTAGTEDWRDAIPDGEARGSVTPDISPDGRYVVFTNRSATSAESFILRLDLMTGEVVSLTAQTVGGRPVTHLDPRWSPDGSAIAFGSGTGDSVGVWLMDPNGSSARAVVDDGFVNVSPAWSPDGRSLVYASYRGHDPRGALAAARYSELPADGPGWCVVRVDVATGVQTVLVQAADGAVGSPVWSPDGGQVDFILRGAAGRSDVYAVPSDGRAARPVQVTLGTPELWLDWR